MNVFLTWQNFRLCSSQAALVVLSLTEVMRSTMLSILGFGIFEKVSSMPCPAAQLPQSQIRSKFKKFKNQHVEKFILDFEIFEKSHF